MGILTVFLEKQRNLVVCTLRKNHRWFWTACYDGVCELIGQDMKDGDMYSARLTVDRLRYVGNKIKRRNTMIKSKKLRMGLSYATVAPIIATIAVYYELPNALIATCIWSGCLIVIANLVTHALTDIAHINKTAK